MLSARVFLKKDKIRGCVETQWHAALKPDARTPDSATRIERELERCVGCIAAARMPFLGRSH